MNMTFVEDSVNIFVTIKTKRRLVLKNGGLWETVNANYLHNVKNEELSNLCLLGTSEDIYNKCKYTVCAPLALIFWFKSFFYIVNMTNCVV